MAAEAQSLGQALKQVTSFAGSLTGKQRLLLAGGAALVAATLFVFVRLTATAEMRPLMTGMDAAEAQALGQRLAAKNIKHMISPDGTSVSVAADQLDAARIETASQPMPRAGRLGFEVFDKPSWATTDFNEKVNYQRALEGELERTLQTLDGVSSARVHLVMSAESVFADREREAKASVVLKLRRGHLSSNEQLVIARLVAGAVDKLDPKNVAVIDGDTNRAFNPSGDPAMGALEGGQSADELLSARIVTTLEPVVGAGKVRASVRVEYDNSSSEENQESYDPKNQVALTTQKSQERNGTSGMSGIPGTASNVPGAGAAPQAKAAATGGDTSESISESSTYAVNRVVRHTLTPSGRVRRMAAALLVDDAISYKQQGNKRVEERHKRTPEEMTQLTDLARAAIGLDTTRGDVISVQNISFVELPAEELPAPTKVEQVRRITNDWLPALRIAAVMVLFLLVYLMMLRPVKKQMLAALRAHAQQPVLAAVAAGEHSKISGGVPEPLPEAKRARELTRELNEKIKAEPGASTRLVQTWLHENK
jgi:flagellar M-ring protein FliF